MTDTPHTRSRKLPRLALVGALVLAGAVAPFASAPAPAQAAGNVTYTLYTSDSPSADEADAYDRIRAAMDAAVARYNERTDISRHLNVWYAPGVPTAEANINGDIRFGSDRGYMNESTALHEMGHTMGVGQSGGFFNLCQDGTWAGAQATALVQSWDGPDARVYCGGGHFWPYGLNYTSEYSDLAADHNVDLVRAMIADGM